MATPNNLHLAQIDPEFEQVSTKVWQDSSSLPKVCVGFEQLA